MLPDAVTVWEPLVKLRMAVSLRPGAVPLPPVISSAPVVWTVWPVLASKLAPDAIKWHVEVHQFRIEAKPGQNGKPTPEGMHRDGVDYVLVLLIDRRNIQSGTTTVHDLDKRALGSFTLTDPLDAALVDDRRCYHGVTPVEPENPAVPAYRDVLVVTFRKKT